jgi:hypothetical protein
VAVVQTKAVAVAQVAIEPPQEHLVGVHLPNLF